MCSLSSTISKLNDFEVERKHNFNYYQNMRLQSRVLSSDTCLFIKQASGQRITFKQTIQL